MRVANQGDGFAVNIIGGVDLVVLHRADGQNYLIFLPRKRRGLQVDGGGIAVIGEAFQQVLLNVDGANIKVLFVVYGVVLVRIKHDVHVFHTHVVDAGDGVLVQKHRVAVVLDKIDLWRVAHRVAAARSVFENRGHEVLRLEFLRILISEGLRFADADAVLDQVADQLGIAHQYVGLAVDITEAILLRIAGEVRAVHEAGVFKVDCVDHGISLLIYILVEKRKAKAPCDGRSRFFFGVTRFFCWPDCSLPHSET